MPKFSLHLLNHIARLVTDDQSTSYAPVSMPSTFTAYRPNIRTKEEAEALARVNRGKFNETPKAAGFIYAFWDSHPDFEGLIKIGFTTVKAANQRAEEIQGRVKGWGNCGRNPILIEDPNQRVVHDVHRCEQLAFAELALFRVKENHCAKCDQSHIEWFEVGESEALRAIERARQYAEKCHGVAEENVRRGLPASRSINEVPKATNNPYGLDDRTMAELFEAAPLIAQLLAQLASLYLNTSVRTTPLTFPQHTNRLESTHSTQLSTTSAKTFRVPATGKRPRFPEVFPVHKRIDRFQADDQNEVDHPDCGPNHAFCQMRVPSTDLQLED